MSNLKVAVCFFGFLRGWKENFPYWDALFQKYSPDIFMHTWDTMQWKSAPVYINDYDPGILPGGPADIDGIKTLYHPKELVAEKYRFMEPIFREKTKWVYEERERYIAQNPNMENIRRNRPMAQISMWYKWYMSSLLKCKYETNFVYDVVVLARSDFRLSHPFDLENCFQITTMPWPSPLAQPEPHVNYAEGINDWWIYGPSKAMDGFCSIYPRIDFIRNFIMKNYDFERIINVHKLPVFNILTNGLKYQKIPDQHGDKIDQY